MEKQTIRLTTKNGQILPPTPLCNILCPPKKFNKGPKNILHDWHLFVGVLYLYTPPKTNMVHLKMNPCKGQRFLSWKPSNFQVPSRYFSGVYIPYVSTRQQKRHLFWAMKHSSSCRFNSFTVSEADTFFGFSG